MGPLIRLAVVMATALSHDSWCCHDILVWRCLLCPYFFFQADPLVEFWREIKLIIVYFFIIFSFKVANNTEEKWDWLMWQTWATWPMGVIFFTPKCSSRNAAKSWCYLFMQTWKKKCPKTNVLSKFAEFGFAEPSTVPWYDGTRTQNWRVKK